MCQMFWIMITWVYSQWIWFKRQRIMNCDGQIWRHDLWQGLVLAETTEEEDICALGRRRAGCRWSDIITRHEVEEQHASTCAACFQMPVTVQSRDGSWCYCLFALSGLRKLSDAQSRWWHIQSYVHFHPTTAKKGTRARAGKMPAAALLFLSPIMFTVKGKRETAGKVPGLPQHRTV